MLLCSFLMKIHQLFSEKPYLSLFFVCGDNIKNAFYKMYIIIWELINNLARFYTFNKKNFITFK